MLAGFLAVDDGWEVALVARGVLPAGGLPPVPGVLEGVLLGKDEPFEALAGLVCTAACCCTGHLV